MERFQQFARNAGPLGVFQTIAVCAIMLYILSQDFASGVWTLSVPAFVAALVLAYLIRPVLVENPQTTRYTMNGIAVVGIVASILLSGNEAPDPTWMRVALVVVFGLYMGCYFWFLSDPDITVE